MDTDGARKWGFNGNPELNASSISVRGVLNQLMENRNKDDNRPTIPLGGADPTMFPSYQTSPSFADHIAVAVRSFKFNCYPPSFGVAQARRAVAEHLSKDLSYHLAPDDMYLTIGCTQAIEIVLSVLARPGANILLPRPGYPQYEARAGCSNLEARHFDLIPERGWEVDFDSVVALADENTVAMVIINPSNPCGNVFTYQHLKKIAETARKLGIFVISDEVYAHLAFGNNPFVPMGVFGSVVPVLTLGSLSKRWIVPGWSLGWIVTTDPGGIFQKQGLVDSIQSYLDITTDPPTFMQGALTQILGQTEEDFFSNILNLLREAADLLFDRVKEIPCLTCPHKPDGSMSVMVKLNLSVLEGIIDDVDFSMKLAKEESVLVLPGVTVGLKNWLRISTAVEYSSLDDGLRRIKAFYHRHAKKE
ncbi:nicotianamine aminotransferase 1-like [Juglans microcarpa x Juglans regia]|uniref:nicotianamine aminotransferase 1-like n=1 Tax=Juglans microcarpa x Juglans regia TaxID=2249226 RepID=UPI001B7DA35A|nr:nicotianamine aminotransferase 1-like [Juglans microcarpa x Juglans regia]